MHKDFFRLYHLLFGVFNLIALLTAFYLSRNFIVDYFSYFTILSNILATTVFLYFGFGEQKTVANSKLLAMVYPPSVLYMMITGIVFWILLHGGHALPTTTQWITLELHGVMPVAVLVGWLLFPPAKRIAWQSVWKWLIFPLGFVFFTLVRGSLVHWYPYVILNPATAGGYVGVLKYVVGILLGSWVIAYLLVQVTNKKKK